MLMLIIQGQGGSWISRHQIHIQRRKQRDHAYLLPLLLEKQKLSFDLPNRCFITGFWPEHDQLPFQQQREAEKANVILQTR